MLHVAAGLSKPIELQSLNLSRFSRLYNRNTVSVDMQSELLKSISALLFFLENIPGLSFTILQTEIDGVTMLIFGLRCGEENSNNIT